MKPIIIKSVSEMIEVSRNIKTSIGFVPTMGFLHEGHLSLVKKAKQETETVIVSIYVNPSQFAPNEDLDKYPRSFERDIQLLAELDVDYVFFPENQEMYPEGYKTWITVEKISRILCGRSRPTHFRGVVTIVAKLMNTVNADYMFMGEKDFQQIVVLEQMIKDLNFKTRIVRCPLIREKDGLAMSSRNKYLSSQQRNDALCLYKSLLMAQEKFNEGFTGSAETIDWMNEFIESYNGVVDYTEIVDPNSLQTISNLHKGCRILVAVKIGKTRLIDNIEIV
ncbi:MAG: pantoate--beta-alanine ligase [Armatimonadetes bacterium]|nr:pantoate--beta-alanine ligase [Armatimonadota bacterium]